MEDLAARLHEENGDDILYDMDEKINSGFYLDKINIDGKFDILRKDEKELILRCYSDKPLDDDLNGCAVYLPLPIRFDGEWFKKFKEMNINKSNLIAYCLDGVLMNDKCCIKNFKTPVDDHVVVSVNRSYIDKSCEVFDLIGNIEERLLKLANRFSVLNHESNKDKVYCEIVFCFRDIANSLRKI